MKTPLDTTTNTVATCSSAKTVAKDLSLTTLPAELLAKITDRLALTEQLLLGRQVGNHHLLDFITHQLATKRCLVLEINHPTEEPAYVTPNPLNGLLRRQLDLWRAAICRIVKQQQLEPSFSVKSEPNARKQNQKQSSSSAFTATALFEELDERVLDRVAEDKKKKKAKEDFSLLKVESVSLSSDEISTVATAASAPVVENENKVVAKDKNERKDEEEDQNDMWEDWDEAEHAWESAHGYDRSVAAALRRDIGLQSRLLPSLTSLEVDFLINDSKCEKIAHGALAALLHSPCSSSPEKAKDEEKESGHNQRQPPLQLTSFALYALNFEPCIFLINFLASFYKILSTTVTPPAAAAALLSAPSDADADSNVPLPNTGSSTTSATSTETATATSTCSNCSLESLKSLTLFRRRTNLLNSVSVDAEDYGERWRQATVDPLGTRRPLAAFPAVEELVLGGIDGSELAFLLAGSTPLFPALRRLVLVLHHLPHQNSKTVTVEALAAQLGAMPAERRHQLTALSVYTFEGLLELHKGEVKREKREMMKEKEMMKGDDQEEINDDEENGKVVVNLAHGKLVAYVKKHFPAVTRFNGQPI